MFATLNDYRFNRLPKLGVGKILLVHFECIFVRFLLIESLIDEIEDLARGFLHLDLGVLALAGTQVNNLASVTISSGSSLDGKLVAEIIRGRQLNSFQIEKRELTRKSGIISYTSRAF